MSSRGSYHHHAPQLKLQVCQEIQSGALRICDAQRKYSVSRGVIQYWLAKHEHGEMDEITAAALADFRTKVAALECKVGQLTMELDLLRGQRRELPRPLDSLIGARGLASLSGDLRAR